MRCNYVAHDHNLCGHKFGERSSDRRSRAPSPLVAISAERIEGKLTPKTLEADRIAHPLGLSREGGVKEEGEEKWGRGTVAHLFDRTLLRLGCQLPASLPIRIPVCHPSRKRQLEGDNTGGLEVVNGSVLTISDRHWATRSEVFLEARSENVRVQFAIWIGSLARMSKTT